MSVRVRLAPSPTGEPHIGNMRAAIFDWLLAKHEGGETIVRVEDTDRARYQPEAVDSLLEALRWLQIEPDEGPGMGGPYGPYVQSERLPLYHAAAEQLIGGGHAYRCYCSPERLEAMRTAQQAAKQPPHYDRRCRWLSEAERRQIEATGVRWVVRFAVPETGATAVNDLIRGEIIFQNATQDDFVLLKSDGFPVYHLAVVVDDHAMAITHVLRGDEWLPSFPKHVLLYQALGYPQPLFAHLPLILGQDHKKLSKRHGDTAVSAFRREGYLPEALFNFLGLLGWSLDDKTEIISRAQFIEHFSLGRVIKSPAIFDIEKLRWMNGVYIRMLPLEALAGLMRERLEAELPDDVARPLEEGRLLGIAPLIQERIKLLSEITPLTDFFFTREVAPYNTSAVLGKRFAAAPSLALELLAAVIEAIEPCAEWTAAALEAAIEPLTRRYDLKKGDLYGLVRVAVTGKTVTPPLFESMAVLGREATLRRLNAASRRLAQAEALPRA